MNEQTTFEYASIIVDETMDNIYANKVEWMENNNSIPQCVHVSPFLEVFFEVCIGKPKYNDSIFLLRDGGMYVFSMEIKFDGNKESREISFN